MANLQKLLPFLSSRHQQESSEESKILTKGIQIRQLYKIFGPQAGKLLPLVQEGLGKDELKQQYNHILGLKNINLDIEAGGIQVVMGLSGSGKSTLIRHINRLIEPTSGEIWVDDCDVAQLSKHQMQIFRRERMAMVFQKFGLFPHQTVEENVALGPTLRGISKRKRESAVAHWIERVGLAGYEDSYPNQLSGGMQQRVGLARALANSAPILLMDEAFSALDPLIRTDMQSVLLDLQKEISKTIVFITHDLDEALRLGDQIAILRDGELIQQGTAAQIILNPADEYIQNFTKDVNRARVLRSRVIMKPTIPTEGLPIISETHTLEEALTLMNQAGAHQAHVHNSSNQRTGSLELQDILATILPNESTQ